MVIGIVGPKSAGKDTAAQYIAKKYGGIEHSHSEILDDVLTVLSLPNSRENTMKLVVFRDKFGENVLINALNKKIKNDDAQLEVITGIRFQNELDNIRSYPKNIVIFMDADLKVRYERQLQRFQRSDDKTMSYEDFVALEQRRTEKDISDLGAQADIKIFHNGTSEELYPKIDAALQGLI